MNENQVEGDLALLCRPLQPEIDREGWCHAGLLTGSIDDEAVPTTWYAGPVLYQALAGWGLRGKDGRHGCSRPRETCD